MMKSKELILCIVLGGGLILPPAVVAQDSPGQAWKNLSPDLREQKRQQYFKNLPKSQQQKLREHQQKFHALPGNQKLALCQRFHSQNGYYPPACQNLIGP